MLDLTHLDSLSGMEERLHVAYLNTGGLLAITRLDGSYQGSQLVLDIR